MVRKTLSPIIVYDNTSRIDYISNITDEDSSGYIYGYSAFGIWRSADYGDTWVEKVNKYSPTYTASITQCVVFNNTIYWSIQRYSPKVYKIYTSSDGLESYSESTINWQEFSGDVLSSPDEKIVRFKRLDNFMLFTVSVEDKDRYILRDSNNNLIQLNINRFESINDAVVLNDIIALINYAHDCSITLLKKSRLINKPLTGKQAQELIAYCKQYVQELKQS